MCNIPQYYYELGYEGLILNTTTPLTVYGLAIGTMISYPYPCYESFEWDDSCNCYVPVNPMGYYDHNGNWHLIGDSALDETYMDFAIMQLSGTQVNQVSVKTRLSIKDDSVAYYLDPQFIYYFPLDKTCCPFPVYEKYFSKPTEVTGSFCIGGWNHSAETCIHGGGKYPEISIVGWGDINVACPIPGITFTYDSTWQITEGWPSWQWFFPILTPDPNGDTTYVPDDSTHNGGDSLRIAIQRTSWERYVSLQPNPADAEATVLSSFGITEVEIFDMAGSRVLTQKAEGLAAKLDVKALPRGSYIVRIHTPLGDTSRKLLLK